MPTMPGNTYMWLLVHNAKKNKNQPGVQWTPLTIVDFSWNCGTSCLEDSTPQRYLYIMHYFNLDSYSTEMSTSQTFYPHHTLSIIFCLFSWRKTQKTPQSLMLFYRDSRSPFFDLLQFNDIDLKIFRRRGASVQSVPGRSQLFDEKKS